MNRLLTTLLLTLITGSSLLLAERSPSTSFSVPSQGSPENPTEPASNEGLTPASPDTGHRGGLGVITQESPGYVPDNSFSSQQQEAEQQQRAENAKVNERISIQKPVMTLPENPLPLPLLERTIKANRLLKQGLKGQDDLVVGLIETADGEVVRNISLVLPITATRGAATEDGCVISVSKLEADADSTSRYLDLTIDVSVFFPEEPGLPPDTQIDVNINGKLQRIKPTGEPVTPHCQVRSGIALQRDEAICVGGLTSTHVSTDKDGNETTQKMNRIYWFLW
ncbi:MAG: hypothetical protein ACQKBW_07615 [Puniceicoccales bacterium]